MNRGARHCLMLWFAGLLYASAAFAQRPVSMLTISMGMRDDLAVYGVQDRVVSWEELKRRVEFFGRTTGVREVVVHVEDAVPTARVLALLSILRTSGFRKAYVGAFTILVSTNDLPPNAVR